MIGIKGEIIVIDPADGELNDGSNGDNKVNIATDIFGLGSNTKNFSDNSFRLGRSKLSDGETYQSKLDYFEGRTLSNDDGDFENPYIIKLCGENITHFTMVFNTEDNSFPTEIYVNGVIYTDDDPIYTIGGLDSLTEIRIEISKWNKPNSKFIISKVYLGIKIDINYRNLVTINCEQRMIMDNSEVGFGIAVNTGRMQLNDLDGEIADYANAGLLLDGGDCVLTLYDSATETETPLGAYVAQDWDYDAGTRSFNVMLENDLLNWQDIMIEKKGWDLNAKISLYEVFNYLKLVTPKTYEFVDLPKGRIIETRLKNIELDSFALESGTLWNKWQEFCEASMLYMFYNNKKQIVFKSGFGPQLV